MLSEPHSGRIPLNHSYKPASDTGNVAERIKALIKREFFAETNQLVDLEKWLRDRCEDRLSGRIIGPKRCGKSTMAMECVDRISGQKGALRPIPLRAHYTDCLTSFDSRKFFNQITKELGRGARGGKPEDYRLRAFDTVELLRVETLLVDNAHYMTEKAICDLIELVKKCGISVILLGPTILDKKLKELDLFDYFKPYFECSNLSRIEFSGPIKTFEREFLSLPEPLELIDADTVTDLFNATNGNFGTLVEILIQVIRRSSTVDTFHFDNEVLDKVLKKYGEKTVDKLGD